MGRYELIDLHEKNMESSPLLKNPESKDAKQHGCVDANAGTQRLLLAEI